jgi:hypothetical protein
MPTFADRGCRVVSATDPHSSILDFLDRYINNNVEIIKMWLLSKQISTNILLATVATQILINEKYFTTSSNIHPNPLFI